MFTAGQKITVTCLDNTRHGFTVDDGKFIAFTVRGLYIKYENQQGLIAEYPLTGVRAVAA